MKLAVLIGFLALSPVANALTIAGLVAQAGKQKLTTDVMHVPEAAILKIAIETQTQGAVFRVCVGLPADFAAGKCANELVRATGETNQAIALGVAGGAKLSGLLLYVVRGDSLPGQAQFKITIE